MIDSHCHSSFSKHAVGSINDVVEAALSAGIKVLTITDHAPFMIDSCNRLLESELDVYIKTIDDLKQSYKTDITILSGLEIDYIPDTENYTRRILQNCPVDFVIGSIHYLSVQGSPLYKVWELSRINQREFLNSYFRNLELLIQSGLFDTLGHADAILRAVPEDEFVVRAEPLLSLLAKSQMAYELNASGLRKSVLDIKTGEEVFGKWSYPSLKFIERLIAHEVKFTIGSDAHDPKDVGAGIKELIDIAKTVGLIKVSYYKNRKRIDVEI